MNKQKIILASLTLAVILGVNFIYFISASAAEEEYQRAKFADWCEMKYPGRPNRINFCVEKSMKDWHNGK